MRVLIVPDVHLKPDMIRDADCLMQTGRFDNTVFLGDFADDWDQGYNTGLYWDTYQKLISFVRKYPQSLVCYGNHDLSYDWMKEESGFSMIAAEMVRDLLKQLRDVMGDRLAYIHRIDQVIFSHAGLTRRFVEKYIDQPDPKAADEIIAIVNSMYVHEMWTSASPIWARVQPSYDPQEMFPGHYLQVVGHTPVKKALYDALHGVLSLDSFSTYSTGEPYGEGRFVFVDTIRCEWDYAD